MKIQFLNPPIIFHPRQWEMELMAYFPGPIHSCLGESLVFYRDALDFEAGAEQQRTEPMNARAGKGSVKYVR